MVWIFKLFMIKLTNKQNIKRSFVRNYLILFQFKIKYRSVVLVNIVQFWLGTFF